MNPHTFLIQHPAVTQRRLLKINKCRHKIKTWKIPKMLFDLSLQGGKSCNTLLYQAIEILTVTIRPTEQHQRY